MEVGAWDVQALPPLAQPAPRQSYTLIYGWQTHALQPWAPTPMEPGTRHTDLTLEELRGGGMGVKEWSKG